MKEKLNLHVSVVKSLSEMYVISEKFVDVEEFWEVAEFWEFWLVESIMSATVAKFPSKIEGRSEWKLVEEMNTIKTRKVFDKLIFIL